MSVYKHHDTVCVCVGVWVAVLCVCRVCVCVCVVRVRVCMCVALGTNAQIYCDLIVRLQCHNNFMHTHINTENLY